LSLAFGTSVFEAKQIDAERGEEDDDN